MIHKMKFGYKVIGLVLSFILMMGFVNRASAQNVTINYRDSYDLCTISFSIIVEGVITTASITGAKNNCTDAENAGCTASPCSSQNMRMLIGSVTDAINRALGRTK
jgi:hypothetical protein